MIEWLKRLFAKIFGPETATQKSAPQDDASKMIAVVDNSILDAESKGRSLDLDRERLLEELCNWEQKVNKIEDQWEALPEGPQKELVWGSLRASQVELSGLKNRISVANNNWEQHKQLVQTLKLTRDSLRAAVQAGMPPQELAALIHQAKAMVQNVTLGLDLVYQSAGGLVEATRSQGQDGSTASSSDQAVLARIAARKGNQSSAAPAPQAASAPQAAPTPQAAPAPQAAPTAPAVQPTPPSPVSPSTPAAADQRADQEGRPC